MVLIYEDNEVSINKKKKHEFIIFIKIYMFLIMAGYLRKLVSLEQALKQEIRDLGDEGIKEVTNKSHSHLENVVMRITQKIIFIIKIQLKLTKNV